MKFNNVKDKLQVITLPLSNCELGYTKQEVLDIIRPLKIHHKTFWKKFGVNTCTIIDNEIIYYECDVELAIKLCLENRDMTFLEWD